MTAMHTHKDNINHDRQDGTRLAILGRWRRGDSRRLDGMAQRIPLRDIVVLPKGA